jgi:hypothetical protein
LSARPDRPRESFARLRRYLEVCAAGPERLTGRDVGMIRLVLAGAVTRRGAPGSERLRRLRARQAALAALPTRAELAGVVAARLDAFPADAGIERPEAVLAPVSAEEAARFGVAEGAPLRRSIARKVRLATAAPVEELVRTGIITSGESLARVVPALTAQVRAAGLADPALRRLYGAVYQAFRRRRSLLLLDLQSQVKLEELPWVRAVEARRQGGVDARAALTRVAALAVASFPHQIVPNRLVRELRALADAAGLKLPFVDELAADIFMDAFAPNFVRAAQAAADLLEGTLYARYYDVPYARLRAIDDFRPSYEGGAPVSPAFFELCRSRAEPFDERGSRVARNGAVIEQAQILTTHNLAVLFGALELREALDGGPEALARRCFAWICDRLQQMPPIYRARLQMVKNAAYAWRQMVFFLSLEPEEVARAFARWAEEHLSARPAPVQARLYPALRGLVRALDGLPPEDGDNARRFTGWTTGTHWLLRERGDSARPG